MLFFKKKKKDNLNVDLKEGSIFVKNDKVPSTFILDRVIDYSPAPVHVRLKEQGGNERTVTVALETLLDENFWRCISDK
ncbi:MAG: hypothetical protein E7013_03860 [Alphaproteobacteria bacterium]|nr:hypothetical protein [Alphaproteobacteria bacterium]